jgi:hypothetical protein
MTKLVNKTMRWVESTSPDVAGYRVYLEQVPDMVDYDSDYMEVDASVTEINMEDFELFTTKDGFYNIGVTALDNGGNESSMVVAENVPLDFVAPNPPGEISFE